MTESKSWEFWPFWMFYAPVGVFVAMLSVRYGVRALPAANPGLPDGGLVGESKSNILSILPPGWTMPFVHLPAAVSAAVACARVRATGWSYPLIAKPDVGQRGVGVRRLLDEHDLMAYIDTYVGDVIVQPWHPGPFEAGIFYVRRPHAQRGAIFSITDKQFPTIVGDGTATLEQLITRHPRFRRQARLFLQRHAAHRSRILEHGERYELGLIGNHAQGTRFVDGAHLITSELEARIDDIARSIPGFFIGRFDVRYTDVVSFKAGRDFAIVELNGVTAESTNIYDPAGTLLGAYRTLWAQWKLVYEIGAANIAAGASSASRRDILRLVWAHLTDARRFPISG